METVTSTKFQGIPSVYQSLSGDRLSPGWQDAPKWKGGCAGHSWEELVSSESPKWILGWGWWRLGERSFQGD